MSTVLHDAIEIAITHSMPDGPGQRNRQLFEFARYLKAISDLANADVASLRPYVVEWHTRALPIITTKGFSESWFDFRNAWKAVKYPAGQEPIAGIFKEAIANGVPRAARQYSEGRLRKLVALCRQLQRESGDAPFYLAGRRAADLLGVSHVQASRWLKLLVLDGVLESVSVGTRRRASEYRYAADDMIT